MVSIRSPFLCKYFLCFLFLLSTSILIGGNSLWEKSCPNECRCTVEPWPYIQLDAKVMRCDNRSLDCLPKNLTSETEVLILSHNNLGTGCDFSLHDFRYLRSLRFFDFSCNRIRTIQAHGIGFPEVRYLNLSHNAIYTIQTEVLADFKGLEYLNLESNYISSLVTAVFALPKLQYLNLRRNRIFTLRPNFYFNAPNLKTLVLSHNVVTRLPDSVFFRTPKLEKLDMSYNRLSRIADLAFDGVRSLSELDLEGNALRWVPTSALRVVPAIGHLVLDRNPIRQLGPTSFLGLNLTRVSLCHDDDLTVVLERTFANMPHLASVELCWNRALTSVAPRALVALPRLQTLDLRFNNLYVVEETIRVDEEIPEATEDNTAVAGATSSGEELTSTGDSPDKTSQTYYPNATTAPSSPPVARVALQLHLTGNPLICDCNLKWVQDILTRQYGHNVTVPESGTIKCMDHAQDLVVGLLERDDLPPQCPPYILPLFHPVVKETVASNVSFMCHGVGIPRPHIQWLLPDGRALANDRCEDRACVSDNTLAIKYLHEEDSGTYECRAVNALGEYKRSLHLEVDGVNVLLFALTITSTFVTLAWNASSLPPTEFQLHYRLSDAGPASEPRRLETSTVNRKVIEVGTKVHSYTVNGLAPGVTYTFWLCIKRADYAIQLSTVEVTTREEGFLIMLGIQRNYASVILIGAAVGIVFLGCTTLCCIKLCRWARKDHEEMVACSESGSSRCFVKSDSCNSEVAFMTYINVDDDTVLVENEDESPQ